MVGPPVHLSRDIDVIHETFNVQRQIGGVSTHQPLQFLTLLVEPDQSPGLGPNIQLVLFGKLFTEMLDELLVKVLASQLRVTGRSKDLRIHGGKQQNIVKWLFKQTH